jgi:tRNA uridine 5-carbamoylmethylation protein Kti12
MPNFVMLAGVPGSGKSTYADQLKAASLESDYQIISRDHYVMLFGQAATLRPGVTYDESWAIADHKQVNRMLNGRLQEALATKQNIILDMTNLTKGARARKLSSVSNEYIKSIMYFPISYEEMMRRAAIRQEQGKTISSKVLIEMFESFKIPIADEGFSILGEMK